MHNGPTESAVPALADTIHTKIKANLPQTASLDRDEHCVQVEEQTFPLGDYIALAVIKEGGIPSAGPGGCCDSQKSILPRWWGLGVQESSAA